MAKKKGRMNPEESVYYGHLVDRWALLQQEFSDRTVGYELGIIELRTEIARVKAEYESEVEELEDMIRSAAISNQANLGGRFAVAQHRSGYMRRSWDTDRLLQIIEVVGSMFLGLGQMLESCLKSTPVKPSVKLVVGGLSEYPLRSNIEQEAERFADRPGYPAFGPRRGEEDPGDQK